MFILKLRWILCALDWLKVLSHNMIQSFNLFLCKLRFLLCLRWLNTVFDTSVSVTFSSKTLDPLVAKIGTKQVNNINFNFLIIELTYVPLPWQHD